MRINKRNSRQYYRQVLALIWAVIVGLLGVSLAAANPVFATGVSLAAPAVQTLAPTVTPLPEEPLTTDQENLLQQAIQIQLEDAYRDYYTIANYQWEFTTTEIEDETLTVGLLLTADVTLRVNAYGMPYYQELYRLWKEASAAEDSASEQTAARLLTMLGNYAAEVNFLYYDKPLSESFEFTATIPLADLAGNRADSGLNASVVNNEAMGTDSDWQILYKGLNGTYPIRSLLLSEEATRAYAREAAAVYLAAPAGKAAPYDTNSQGYNRRAARKYALEEFYNPQFYGQYSSNCANFVSYCLNEGGGLSRTNSWRPGAYNWIRTGYNGVNGVSLHVTRNAGFSRTDNRATVSAGAIVSWREFSHVGLITYGDGTKLRFTAHTTYRQDFVLPAAEAVIFYQK